MNSTNPAPINGPTSRNDFPVTSPLSDQGRQGDIGLGSHSDFVSTGENLETSAVTVESTIPELSVAYNRTFLQIPLPSVPKKEMLAQLEPFSRTVATDLSENLIAREYAIEEANVQISSDILNIIEKAMEAANNNKKHYGPTGINAEVTEETSPVGSQGLMEQEALLHSLGNITLKALGTPTHENFSSTSLETSHSSAGAPHAPHQPQGVGLLGVKSNLEGANAYSSWSTPDLTRERQQLFSAIGSLNQLLSNQSLELPKLKGVKETSSQEGSNNDYNLETSQISHQFLSAEEENSFEETNELNRTITREETALAKFQGPIARSLQHSLSESLDTLKRLINNPSWTTPMAA